MNREFRICSSCHFESTKSRRIQVQHAHPSGNSDTTSPRRVCSKSMNLQLPTLYALHSLTSLALSAPTPQLVLSKWHLGWGFAGRYGNAISSPPLWQVPPDADRPCLSHKRRGHGKGNPKRTAPPSVACLRSPLDGSRHRDAWRRH